MAKTLVIIRDLQQVPTLPIAINFTTVRYIDIYVVKIKILVALFSAKIHPSSTIRQVRVRLNIEVHLLLTCDKYIMNTQIIVYRKTVDIESEIAYIRIEQTASKVLRCFNLQPNYRWASNSSNYNTFHDRGISVLHCRLLATKCRCRPKSI